MERGGDMCDSYLARKSCRLVPLEITLHLNPMGDRLTCTLRLIRLHTQLSQPPQTWFLDRKAGPEILSRKYIISPNFLDKVCRLLSTLSSLLRVFYE